MNINKFEEILRWEYDNGKRNFIGNLSGNKYSIQNTSSCRNGYILFVNGVAAKRGNFFSIAYEIWDIESKVAGVE